MVEFKDLKISKDGKYLIIDVAVKDSSYYNNVYLQSIKIDTQKTYRQGLPSSRPIYSQTFSSGTKRCSISLDYRDLGRVNLSKTMFFVYVTVTGAPQYPADYVIGCADDKVTTLGVTFDIGRYLKYLMNGIRQIEKHCMPPKGFIDALLRLKAVQISIDTGNYQQAIEYFNDYIADEGDDSTASKSACGCYGNLRI